jgi:hypothetical protein
VRRVRLPLAHLKFRLCLKPDSARFAYLMRQRRGIRGGKLRDRSNAGGLQRDAMIGAHERDQRQVVRTPPLGFAPGRPPALRAMPDRNRRRRHWVVDRRPKAFAACWVGVGRCVGVAGASLLPVAGHDREPLRRVALESAATFNLRTCWP